MGEIRVNIFLQTIIHTGTHTFKFEYHDHAIQHQHFAFAPEEVAKFSEWADELYTTYRNPFHVAISWANHSRLADIRSQRNKFNWYAQWEEWADWILADERVKLVNIHKFTTRLGSIEDKRKLYQALYDNDSETYFNAIPEKAIKFAQAQVARVAAAGRLYPSGTLRKDIKRED